MTDANGQIVWAAGLDAWGNVLDKYDPHGIGQPIRLPGQIHDRETGLFFRIDITTRRLEGASSEIRLGD
ncbi:RHS domain-containing protein [Comamonas sp.]|uniref:RHS domain-containing protein n=1 Tax=Comamonas sp. TaxID=34028 RepID=UPI00391863AD